jgi:TolB-like protein
MSGWMVVAVLFCMGFQMNQSEIRNFPALTPQTIAVGTFDTNDETLANQIRQTLVNALASSEELRVVDRLALKQIIEEQRFQQLGLVPDKERVAPGSLYAASILLTGSIYVEGLQMSLQAHCVDVRTGAVLPHSAERLQGSITEWHELTLRLADSLHRRLTGDILMTGLRPTSLPVEGIPATVRKPDYENSPYFWHIEYVIAHDLMRPYPDGAFRPTEVVSQRYFMAVLTRLQPRVGAGHFYEATDPETSVTRMQAVLAIKRLATGSVPDSYYLDVPQWAKGIVGWDATRSAPLTREVLAALMTNLLKSMETPPHEQGGGNIR